jgi:hypothetical protein
LNADDDDYDGMTDLDDDEILLDGQPVEDETVKIVCEFTGLWDDKGTVYVTRSTTSDYGIWGISLWKQASKGMYNAHPWDSPDGTYNAYDLSDEYARSQFQEYLYNKPAWIEGIETNVQARGTFLYVSYYVGPYSIVSQGVRITVAEVDLDVDSDNNNGLDAPSRDAWEDAIEDREGSDYPGKFVLANDDDTDNDGIPDFADGFNKFGGTSGQTAGERFVPLVLQLSQAIDASKARVRFIYDGSDPGGVERTGEAPNYVYSAAPGTLRIWKKDGGQVRTLNDYVAPNQPVACGMNLRMFYIEGIAPSAGVGGTQIKVEIDPDGDGPADYELSDVVRVTVIGIDLDIDSDNNNGFHSPDRSLVEDHYEDKTGDAARPGKFIMANDNDTDGDGIPDFAQVSDSNYPECTNTVAGETFVPLVLQLPAPIDVATARLRFTYGASDPAGVQRSGEAPGYTYTAPPGKLRIWTHPGYAARSRVAVTDGGDYVPKDVVLAPADLGFTDNGSITLYVEAIDASTALADVQIKVELDPDGDGPADWVCLDAVRLTVLRLGLTVYGGDGATAVKFRCKSEPGAFVWLNRDDDDENDQEDREDTYGSSADDDLIRVRCDFSNLFSTLEKGTVILQRDNDRIRLWKNPEKAGEPGESEIVFQDDQRCYDLSTAQGREDFQTEVLQKDLWLEGVASSEQLGDTGLWLFYQCDLAQDVGEDYVALTVLQFEVTHVAFNHDRTGHADDAVSIRTDGNAGTKIEAPEWVVDNQDAGTDPQKNEPALYVAGQSVTVLVRFRCTPEIASASIRAVGSRTQEGGLSLGNLGAAEGAAESWKTVTFDAGISVGSQVPAGTGEEGFVAFAPQNKTANAVQLEDVKWQFRIKSIGGDSAIPWLCINAPGQKKRIRLYTILEVPKAPWTGDTAGDDKKQPWTAVLEKSCNWAKEKASNSEALGAVTQGIYDSGFQYDNDNGAPSFQMNSQFNLARCIEIWGTGTVNCWDCAAMVCIFGNVIGCDSSRWHITRNGGFLLNYIKAIGRDWTNNPFSRTPRVGFSHHWTAWQEVFDACLMVDDAAPPGSASPSSSTLPKTMESTEYLDKLVDPSNRTGTSGAQVGPPDIYLP